LSPKWYGNPKTSWIKNLKIISMKLRDNDDQWMMGQQFRVQGWMNVG
jgi:hypothetical protein